MIRTIEIENYKSLPKLSLELGRLTVLIGANGSGKSNILEAIALASAAAQNKLDNEFLISRGIRVTDTGFMCSAFEGTAVEGKPANAAPKYDEESSKEVHSQFNTVRMKVLGDDGVDFSCVLYPDDKTSYPQWRQRTAVHLSELRKVFEQWNLPKQLDLSTNGMERLIVEAIQELHLSRAGGLPGFLIFSPENSALRTFQAEGQIFPLGIKGEGLFSHLRGLGSGQFRERLEIIRNRLRLIEWFENFVIPENLSPGEKVIKIQDRFIPYGTLFDQRSANEGFLFLLFYMTLFISPETPSFFAIDNIDNSLNPKICTELARQIGELATEYNKQVILTSHNPAVLDGLDLCDKDQRLLVVDRDKKGFTRVRRISPPQPLEGKQPVSLSEAFLKGYIGGLPKNF